MMREGRRQEGWGDEEKEGRGRNSDFPDTQTW
jgi:hypothetical protein